MKPATKTTGKARSGSLKRVVSLLADKTSCIGAWEITCPECPMRPHLEALNMKPKACVAGMQTNMQGAVPLSQCEHYEKDSIKSEGKSLTLQCTKAG